MFDIWYGDVEVTTCIMILCAVLLFPVQLLLCFKVKSLFLRLVPVGLLGSVFVWFLLLSLCVPGWDGLGYTVLAIYAGFMLAACGLGWAARGLYLWYKKRHETV